MKDPYVPSSVQLYRAAVSLPVTATLLTASVTGIARRYVVHNALARWTNKPLIVGDALTLLFAVPVGVGLAGGLRWLRWQLITRLLTYKGWLFEQTSLTTKAWAILLKLLVGPGPHTLYEFEDSLPRLPLPSLEQTCTKYLETVKPLLSDDDFEHTRRLVLSLQQNEGPVLQKYLEKRRASLPSWLADWWSSSAYLSRREPIAINVNFFMMSTVRPEVSENSLARAVTSLISVTKYYEMIQNQTLPPDMIQDMVPVCMDSVRYMLGSCRIPGIHIDTLTLSGNSRHVIIISKGVYFRLDMYVEDKRAHNGRRICSKLELKRQLNYILQQTTGIKEVNAVAALTADNRTEWAKNRQLLLQHPVNAATLRDIETAIFILVLGDYTPRNEQEEARLGLTGDGTSRWFDKCLTLEMFKNSSMAIGNMEHSGTDATHFEIMWEHCLQEEEFGPDGDIIIDPSDPVNDNLPAPVRLEWQFTSDMQATIKQCLENYKKMIDNVDLVVFHTSYGKKWMKKQRVSPDGFLQMAIQLAYWQIHHEFTKTYEPASHRLFALGRTDNINPVSEHSVRWVHAMQDTSCSRETRIRLLHEAIKYQNKVRLEATAGQGSDRHLLGLACAARELGMDLPAVFTDKAYQLPMKLSTSQVPTNLGQFGLPLIPESCVGGFGPVCEDGYGLLYCSMGDDMFNFNITSWKSYESTDSGRLANGIRAALETMRHLLEGQSHL
jgi:carnitine O-palmitoyltransferase 1